MRAFLVISVFGLFAITPASAEEQEEDLSSLFACLETYRDAPRLDCYDDAVSELYEKRFPPAIDPNVDTGSTVVTTENDTGASEPQNVADRPRVEPGRFLQRVTKFGYDSNDKIVIWLENGEIWKQSDRTYLKRQTRNGVGEAELKRGLLSATWITLDGGESFKAKRIE